MTEAAETLDLRGVPCPANAARALLKLELMDAGEVLRVLVSAGEALTNLPESVKQAGHELAAQSELPGGDWELLVKRG